MGGRADTHKFESVDVSQDVLGRAKTEATQQTLASFMVKQQRLAGVRMSHDQYMVRKAGLRNIFIRIWCARQE